MDETILSKGAPTTDIANAIAGTPPDTPIANKTTTRNTATAAATTEGSVPYQTRSAKTARTKTKDTTIDTGTAIATTTDVTTKDTSIDTSAATTKETTIDKGAAIAMMTELTTKPSTTIDTGTATTKDTTIDKSAAFAMTKDVTTDINEGKRRMILESQDVTAKNAKTTMPEVNNAATMTGSPDAATSPSGSVADHDSSKFVARNDLGQTSKGNKKVSIISDMFLIPKWN
jgi:hypothetical protein